MPPRPAPPPVQRNGGGAMTAAPCTLRDACEWQVEIRKSRFRALAAPAATPDTALALLRGAAVADATHNCWAYRIGQDYRFHDDGEPGGTAGRPILQAIDAQGCDRVAVLVTRWYGGIKLGTGGLARAYGGTAAECLRMAERVPIVAMARLALEGGFADLALVKARLSQLDATLLHEHFEANGATLECELPAHRISEAEVRIADLSRGRIAVRRID